VDHLVKKQSEVDYATGVVESMDLTKDSNIQILQDISAEASRLHKELEAERVSATKPLNATLRQINGWFKPVMTACDTLKRRANARLVEASKAREEARELALGEIAKQGPHIVNTVIMPAQAKPVELPKGVGRAVIEVHVDDAAKVPREYLMPDLAAIKRDATRAQKDGTPFKVPGITIVIKESGT
jgi:gluconate kinase